MGRARRLWRRGRAQTTAPVEAERCPIIFTQRLAAPSCVVQRCVFEQAEFRPDAQLSLGQSLGSCSLPRFEIGFKARLGLFDRFAEAPLFLQLVFGGVFLAARRAR
jgi:hypothetical protein